MRMGEAKVCVCVWVFPGEGSLKKTISIIIDTIVRNSPKPWSFYQICVVKVRIIQKCFVLGWHWLYSRCQSFEKKWSIHKSGDMEFFFHQSLGYLGHFLHEKWFEVCIGLKSHFSGWNFVKKTTQKEDDEFKT
jgi:hypothetical protein